MNTRLKALLFLLLMLLSSVCCAQDLKSELAAAIERLDEGTHQLESRQPQANNTLAQASAMFEHLIKTYQLHTPEVQLALGNAYMLQGDTGRAVIAYRRGEQIDPTDIKLKESLAHARSLVEVSVAPSITSRVWKVLLGWRGYVPRSVLWYTFAALFTLGWLMLSIRLLSTRTRLKSTLGIWLLISSIVPASVLTAEWVRFEGATDAVIVEPKTIARLGPDDQIYDPAFVEPLEPGVEGRLLEIRNGWVRVALADRSTCWVPQTSLELVYP